MDVDSIQRMMAAMLEDHAKKAQEREEAAARSAAERERILLEELKALKSAPPTAAENSAEGDSGETTAHAAPQPQQQTAAAAAAGPTPLSRLPLIAEIEAFEPTDADDDEDGAAGKFDEWLKRFQFSLECGAPHIDDRDKVKFLMTRLSKDAFSEYNKMCMPRDVTEFSYAETAQRLRELFEPPQYSLFADRYECLRIVKDDAESFRAYFQRVKIALRKFNFSALTEEQFSCLVALAGIRAAADEAARTAILQRLNADGEKVRYEQVVGDCINLLKVREAADSSYQRSSARTAGGGGGGRRRGNRGANH